jgi:hypothetical protein
LILQRAFAAIFEPAMLDSATDAQPDEARIALLCSK